MTMVSLEKRKRKRLVRIAGERCCGRLNIPYRTVVEKYTEEHPFRRNRTPKLPKNVYQPPDLASLNLGRSTHCHTAIHRAFCLGVDEEEGCSRDAAQRSNYNSVLPLELAQSCSIVFIEDDKEDIDCHSKGPEYICEWKPVRVVVSVVIC
jgi:hypothetical protein